MRIISAYATVNVLKLNVRNQGAKKKLSVRKKENQKLNVLDMGYTLGDLFLGKLFYDYDYFHHLVSTCEIDNFDSFGSGMNKWYSKVKFTDEDCCDTDRCIFSVSKSNSQDISVKRNEFLKKQGFEGREAVAEYTTETGDARTELYYDSDNNTGCFLVTKICNKDGEKKEVELYGAAIDEIVIGETPDISMLDYSSEDKEGWDYLNEFGITKVTEEKDGRIVGISYNPAEYADIEYSRAAEPPVRCGESHVSGLTGATLL